MKEMNLHLKCHARFEEKMKSRRQPDDFSSFEAAGKTDASHRALRRQSAGTDQVIRKQSPGLEMKQSANIKEKPHGGERWRGENLEPTANSGK